MRPTILSLERPTNVSGCKANQWAHRWGLGTQVSMHAGAMSAGAAQDTQACGTGPPPAIRASPGLTQLHGM